MNILKSKRGSAQIKACIIVIVVCMFLSVLIQFTSAVNVVNMTKRNTRIVLDGYIMENSIEIFNSIKQGNDYLASYDTEKYLEKLAEFCTFERSGQMMYSLDTDGKRQFWISSPVIHYETDNELKLYITYDIYIPMYFAGIRTGTSIIPMKIQSKFNEKI